MKWNKLGRVALAAVVSLAMALGLSACGSFTTGFMWVLGTQYNQIAAFKIDDFTGNLTRVINSPFTSGGGQPVSIVVRAGGRYVYVLNQNSPNGNDIALFSVGGDGVLAYQLGFSSQGTNPQWLAIDSAGAYLYVLDQISPRTAALPVAQQVGAITVFAIDSGTGRLSPILNNQVKDPNGTGQQLPYFEVGGKPTMLFNTAGCMFAMDTYDQTIYSYTASTGGQLTTNASGAIPTGATKLTSINGNSSHIYLTDGSANKILPYTPTSSCGLTLQTGGAVSNLANTANPVNTLIDYRGKYLYVINQSNSNANAPASTISAFALDATTGQLSPVVDVQNPYSVGATPMCILEDPSHQYLYTSNYSGTVTGKIIFSNTGQLADLSRGSSFAATGQTTCLAISGNTN